jgi:hypothetical protein
MPIARIRNRTMARWLSAHSVKVERFHRVACFVSAEPAGRGERDPQARRHLCTPAGNDEAHRRAARKRGTSSLRYRAPRR